MIGMKRMEMAVQSFVKWRTAGPVFLPRWRMFVIGSLLWRLSIRTATQSQLNSLNQ